ncbi:MAG: Fur family transcriptional regulator, ferric uptake regulator [Actinomycetota bacterium]|jgi:Fur family ferric uptake transcriptional regulator|nr:Fur family transcriptional regulator, ferric uptake regulator [Actinomycetota bacterium]
MAATLSIARELHETAAQRLRAAGQRYTPQRRSITELLGEAGSPLAMPAILEGVRGLTQSSAYRNLAVLEQVGLVRRVITVEDFAHFELTEELTGHHHHLVCSSCGRVEDVALPTEVEEQLDRSLDRSARRAGFASVQHRLDLIGTCRDCS